MGEVAGLVTVLVTTVGIGFGFDDFITSQNFFIVPSEGNILSFFFFLC
jgi:hypothetical protein